jgi:aryl-alcohol dehydrogenase-like predicted oxidoreductase
MQYTRLGTSGLKVSRIALGCMSFGDTSQMPWALDDDGAEPIFRQAVESGINFWDTANICACGTSEEIVGRAIKRYTKRDDVVLATKLFNPMHDGPGGAGLLRCGGATGASADQLEVGALSVNRRLVPRLVRHCNSFGQDSQRSLETAPSPAAGPSTRSSQ